MYLTDADAVLADERNWEVAYRIDLGLTTDIACRWNRQVVYTLRFYQGRCYSIEKVGMADRSTVEQTFNYFADNLGPTPEFTRSRDGRLFFGRWKLPDRDIALTGHQREQGVYLLTYEEYDPLVEGEARHYQEQQLRNVETEIDPITGEQRVVTSPLDEMQYQPETADDREELYTPEFKPEETGPVDEGEELYIPEFEPLEPAEEKPAPVEDVPVPDTADQLGSVGPGQEEIPAEPQPEAESGGQDEGEPGPVEDVPIPDSADQPEPIAPEQGQTPAEPQPGAEPGEQEEGKPGQEPKPGEDKKEGEDGQGEEGESEGEDEAPEEEENDPPPEDGFDDWLS
jgi:hypothetical protein